jgi:hypothetical protein
MWIRCGSRKARLWSEADPTASGRASRAAIGFVQHHIVFWRKSLRFTPSEHPRRNARQPEGEIRCSADQA